VSFVVCFEEDTPLALIRRLRPDVLVKGADYRVEEVVGGDDVTRDGGRVVLLPLTPGRSTSALARRLGAGFDTPGEG
jgi:D-beta-D-heptose 7-phosphate kinase/D-beta-D-heptose 1-phosphate adenosyltransferase